MRVATPRIGQLAAVLGLAAVVLLVNLYLLMIEQQPAWLERSLRNRWMFRDVPAPRGRVLDRDGRILAEDVAGFAALLHYRSFRRMHVVGCVVHGANLAMQASGISDDLFGYRPSARAPREALTAFLATPAAWLRSAGGPVAPEKARDLRFYASGMLVAAGVHTRREAYRRVAAASNLPVTLREALGEETTVALTAALEARLAELDELDTDLRTAAAGRGLWEVLDDRRQEHAANPPAEHAARVLHRHIPYALAARIDLLRDRHPGLWLRPSVDRQVGRVPGRDDLASLRPVVGVVTPVWAEDRQQIISAVGNVLDRSLEDLLEAGAEVWPELQPMLEAEAERSMQAHFEVHGRIGRSGLEREFDAWLAGQPGLRLVERDRRAREQGQLGSVMIFPGRDLRLTLDLHLQACLERVLDQEVGSIEVGCVILDPKSGDLLAAGARPLAASKTPAWTSPVAVWSGVGYLGSIVKPFVALEQLDAVRHNRPARDASGFVPCGGGYRVMGLDRPLGCSGQHGDGARDVQRALGASCNFYFYQAAEGLGAAGLRLAFSRAGWLSGDPVLGLDQPTVPGFDVVGRARLSPRGHVLQRQAIGYGLEASVLHVARAYAALATGSLPTIGLVAGDRNPAPVPLDVHPADLDTVRDGLRACVTSGTAASVEGLAAFGVLGKTGSAEISTVTRRNNAWFAGWLTRAQPTLAFAAVVYGVEDGEHGGERAGGIVRAFLAEISVDPELRQRYLPVETGR